MDRLGVSIGNPDEFLSACKNKVCKHIMISRRNVCSIYFSHFLFSRPLKPLLACHFRVGGPFFKGNFCCLYCTHYVVALACQL